jgi:hypothetical protein
MPPPHTVSAAAADSPDSRGLARFALLAPLWLIRPDDEEPSTMTAYQKFIIVLAFLQFTVVLDFH